MTSTVTVRADTPECQGVIQDCNKALDAADKALAAKQTKIDLQDKALSACYQDNQSLRVSLVKESDKNTSLLRNPWFTGALGAVAGILGYTYLSRH